MAHDNKRSSSTIQNNLIVAGQKQNVLTQIHTNWPVNTATSSACVQSLIGMCSVGNGANVFMLIQAYGNPIVTSGNPSYATNLGNVFTPPRSHSEHLAFNNKRCNVREVIDALPTFNPMSDGITSAQFIEKVENN